MPASSKYGRLGHSIRLWPILLALIAAAVVPAACVLWFVNTAMHNEALAVRQRLADLYRQRLQPIQMHIAELWRNRQLVIAQVGELPPAQAFATVVKEGTADALLVRGGPSQWQYPVLELPSAPVQIPPFWRRAEQLERAGRYEIASGMYAAAAAQGADDTAVAMALRAQGRCLLQAGNQGDRASEVLLRLAQPQFAQARDEDGRLIVPDGLLLIPPSAADAHGRAQQTIAAIAMDYSLPMLSAQRLFLMQGLNPSDATVSHLMHAERIALEESATQIGPADGVLCAIPSHSRWALAAGTGKLLGIYEDATVRAMVQSALPPPEDLPGAHLQIQPPGHPQNPESLVSVSLGQSMPGWIIAVQLDGSDPLLAASQHQRFTYLWTAAIALLAITAGSATLILYVSRQVRLTRLKNDLIATVSHELKTPLASSRMLLETLLAGRIQSDHQQHEYLTLIARENQRLSRLIDNFLTFSRIERNKHQFQMEHLCPADFIQPAVEAVRDRFSSPSCQLTLHLPPDLPPVHGDRDALTTVIVNLLDNAWKYTLDTKQVELSARANGTCLEIRVRDNGIGLSARHCKRVFDRFYQVDQTLSRRAGGCGLGLSIVKYIVEEHGGQVAVASAPGAGSTFTVSLPIRE